MNFTTSVSEKRIPIDIDAIAASIIKTQKSNGEIPWSDNDKTDPWDHVESIIGLTIGGYIKEARKGFEWIVKNQLEDGSYYSSYKNGKPDDMTREANMSSYIAVGVFHHYLITKDINFLQSMWNTVCSGLNFALSLQAPSGIIHWAKSPDGVVDPMALLTGSSSVYMSLKCGIAISEILGKKMPEWNIALPKLGDAIKNKPHLFNINKSRFSMDWFYPILCGALTGEKARKKIDKHWKKFVVEGFGVRCVSDEPWVTIAETSEFILSLSAMGNHRLAKIIFSWIQDKVYDDGSYWCGFTFPDIVIWPEEKITWTNGVFLMATDALFNLTPASNMFSHKFWNV